MKTLAYNNFVIAKGSATFGSKPCGNLHETTSNLNQGDCFVDNFNSSNLNFKAPRNDRPKFFSRVLLIGLMTLLLSPLSFAQDFDTNRMNRDIKIMENVLDELFKVDPSSNVPNTNFRVFSSGSALGRTKGTYVQGFGVIFKIPRIIHPGFSSIEVNKGENTNVTFFYDTEDEDTAEITQESIIDRISEFLQDYATNIGQLKPEDKVLVIYGMKGQENQFFTVYNARTLNSSEREKKQIPLISVSAKKSILDDYRTRKINEEQFKNRFDVVASENKEFLDLKVMSNILKTAVGESKTKKFRVSGDPSYLLLDNFGALFSMNVKFVSSSWKGSVVFESREAREAIRASGVNQVSVLSPEEAKEKQAKDAEELQKDLMTFKKEVKEYLIDYGRTIKSIESDQFILCSIYLEKSWGSGQVPDQIDFQVKKNIIEQLDKGQISREAALNAVTLTEY